MGLNHLMICTYSADDLRPLMVNLYHCCISLEILSNHKVKSDNGSRYKAR